MHLFWACTWFSKFFPYMWLLLNILISKRVTPQLLWDLDGLFYISTYNLLLQASVSVALLAFTNSSHYFFCLCSKLCKTEMNALHQSFGVFQITADAHNNLKKKVCSSNLRGKLGTRLHLLKTIFLRPTFDL